MSCLDQDWHTFPGPLPGPRDIQGAAAGGMIPLNGGEARGIVPLHMLCMAVVMVEANVVMTVLYSCGREGVRENMRWRVM